VGIIFHEYKKAYYLSSRKLAFQFFRKHNILANDRLIFFPRVLNFANTQKLVHAQIYYPHSNLENHLSLSRRRTLKRRSLDVVTTPKR